MTKLFSVLTLANWAILLGAMALGFAHSRHWISPSVHELAGLGAVLFCITVHCALFTYFIATAKWVRHACATKGLANEFVLATRSFRSQAFPALLLAMLAVFSTAITGVMVDSYQIPPLWHAGFAVAAILTNIVTAIFERAAIRRNMDLIGSVLNALAGG